MGGKPLQRIWDKQGLLGGNERREIFSKFERETFGKFERKSCQQMWREIFKSGHKQMEISNKNGKGNLQ